MSLKKLAVTMPIASADQANIAYGQNIDLNGLDDSAGTGVPNSLLLYLQKIP